MGSVTERVLAHAPCPVLVIRSKTPFQKMLIPLDGSALSERALAPALDIASAFNAAVTLLRVVREVPAQHVEELEDVEQGLGLRMQEEMGEEAGTYLQNLVQAYPARNLQMTVRSGPAADVILSYADSHGVDVVAMATHGRSGAQRWVYGSVTEKILHNSTSFAMLIVRPQP
jgi:nucleotide-binding universal stress UspA family protein